jgi:phage-related tail fiber protein
VDKLFYARLTSAGERKFAAAAVSGEPVNFSEMAVGDGGGIVPDLSENDDLVNELYRAPLNRVIADQGANIIRTEMIMMPQVGGFWVREAGLYDNEESVLLLRRCHLPISHCWRKDREASCCKHLDCGK